MNRLVVVIAALFLISPLPAAAGVQLDRKTRKQLEQENTKLREKLEDLQREIEMMRSDTARDSLEQELADYFDSPAYGGGEVEEMQESERHPYLYVIWCKSAMAWREGF